MSIRRLTIRRVHRSRLKLARTGGKDDACHGDCEGNEGVSSKGKRVRVSGAQRTVIDGPFTETKELIAGFWLWQVKSIDEAVEWLKRCPNPHNEETEVEIRPVFEAEDFGAELTPELREQKQRIREQAAARQK
jgi:hypothetical protein